jgi:hypothetical protein
MLHSRQRASSKGRTAFSVAKFLREAGDRSCRICSAEDDHMLHLYAIFQLVDRHGAFESGKIASSSATWLRMRSVIINTGNGDHYFSRPITTAKARGSQPDCPLNLYLSGIPLRDFSTSTCHVSDGQGRAAALYYISPGYRELPGGTPG